MFGNILSWGKNSQTKEKKSFNPFNGFGNVQTGGVDVNYTSAMRQQDVYTCIRIKAESIGQLPVQLFRVDSRNVKKLVNGGRDHKIFTKRPNPYQTWQEFNETYVTAMELLGNFFAEVKRNKYGSVYEIIPFEHQNNVQVGMNRGQVYYTYATNDGQGKQSFKSYEPSNILHIKQHSINGYRGLSPIDHNHRTIGSAIAADDHSASMFENGASLKGVLTTDEVFGEDDDGAISRIKKGWSDIYGGKNNAGKTAVLEYGLKYQSIAMSAVDTQLIEQRKYSREQICSLFRVPSHMLNDPSGMKYNTVEHNNTAFFRDSLMPLITKLENNINELVKDNQIIALNEREFVRGDRATQVKTIKEEISAGLCSVAEGRSYLGYEPVDGTDVFVTKSNNFEYGEWANYAKNREEDRKLELQERKAKIKQMNQPKVAPSDKKETANVK